MKGAIFLIALFIAFSISCTRPVEVVNSDANDKQDTQSSPERAKVEIPIHIAGFSSSELCDRLISIDTLPTHDPDETDPIYEALILKGEEAMPCLVEKISDKTPMPDPRYSVPHWQHFAVGDTAVFVLIDILRKDDLEREKLLIEMLAPKYEKEWETNGIYAYFNYVSEPKNRKALQTWWRKWLKDNAK